MDLQTHTTPGSRQALRTYLHNRRLTASLHHTIMDQALADLEEALNLLQGLQHPSTEWAEDIESFLALRLPAPSLDPSLALPGLFDGHRDLDTAS